MSIKKPLPMIIALAVTGCLLLSRGAMVAQTDEDLLEYYWGESATVWGKSEADRDRLQYRLRVRTLREKLERGGRISQIDTSIADYFYSGSTLDSLAPVAGRVDDQESVQLFPPDVYEYSYHLNLYPNDDGRGDLAVGLDSDSGDTGQPTGLAMIDRYTYHLRRLYLHYEPFGDFMQFTRSFVFRDTNGVIFPDSVSVVASKLGVLFPERFRLETEVVETELYTLPAQPTSES